MCKLWERISTSYSVNGMALQTLMHYKTYRETYKFLKESQWWNIEQLEQYQLQQLSKLLNHAYENVPYYTKVFDKLGLKPKDIQSIQDLQKLPILTREIVQKNINDLKATNYPESKFELSRTGGSTGLPLQFYREKGVWTARQKAYSKILMEWADRSFFDRGVFITGEKIPFKYQLFGRTLVLSSFFMNDKYMPIFIQKIRKLKPKYFLTFPSAITNLANYMKNNSIEAFPSLEIIICYAETLYEWQQDLLEEVFQSRVFNQYGLRESAVTGGTCGHSNYFHMFPQYGIVELIGKDGRQITKEGEIGEIIGTGFHTYIFPFIRYKTDDLGVYTSKKCECGRNYPLLERIEGRSQEFLVSKTNRLASLTGFFGLIVKSSLNVKESQLYQDTPGEIVISIVKGENYSESDTKHILENFQKRLGDEFSVSIRFVDHIPRTKRGKFQYLIQKLPITR